MVVLTSIAFLIALLTGVAIVRAQSRAGTLFHYGDDKPQRFHVGHVPRLGGLALGAGLSVAWLVGALVDGVLVNLNLKLNPINVLLWLLVMMPALLTGLMEDMTQRLPVSLRLLATFGTATLACWLLDLGVHRLDIGWIDQSLNRWPWLAVVLAVMAIAGLPHAFNIIDGYNGLAGTVALLISLALAHVALQVGDRALAALMMALAGATAGFLVWNYPVGLIFLGDGGAYFIGFMLGELALLLVMRNPEVSTWYAALLLIYPAFETLFSVYRRMFVRGKSPAIPDGIHLHSLIFRRVVQWAVGRKEARALVRRNSLTSPYLWLFSLSAVIPATLFWNNTTVLIACCLVFMASYIWIYVRIVRFKAPRWMIRHKKP